MAKVCINYMCGFVRKEGEGGFGISGRHCEEIRRENEWREKERRRK